MARTIISTAMNVKLTKRQTRYLEAIKRGDWKQSHKEGNPATRIWATKNQLIIRGTKGGDLPIRLTEKARSLLSKEQ